MLKLYKIIRVNYIIILFEMEEETTLKATHDMENNSQSKEIPIE